MEAIQFEVNLQGEVIHVPPRYRDWQGRKVQVILLSEDVGDRAPATHSALDILARTPGHRLFQTADDVDQYLRAERAQWDY